MKIRMLGPFDVQPNGRSLKLAGPKQRAVLSMLALNANAANGLERLIEGLWGDEPPSSAPKMVQQYVSQLRRLLGEDGGVRILTHGRGYALEVEADEVDALRFERLVRQAAREDAGARGERAREALELWHGPPLADLLDAPFAAAEIRRLEELHLAATEFLLESDLAAGRDPEVISRLQTLVAEHPLRERLRCLLMLALYRDGRQAEALDAFQDARWTFVETLGIEPGPELRRLQEAILRQDETLERVVPDDAWASRETVRQLGAGAGAVSRRRGALRADELELAQNVIDLQTLRARPSRAGLDAARPSCPYKGLEAFDTGDAEDFFGRERLVAEMVARIPGTGLLGVIGRSGSGKSSALRAGLLPALASGVLPGSERWTRVVMRPGDRPRSALRRALRAPPEAEDPIGHAISRVAADSRLLLCIDQFEELFTACEDVVERVTFLDELAAPATRGEPRYLAVLALRADFYEACAAHPQLARALGDSQVLVGPMRPDELAHAIEGPALRAGLEVEPELVSRLVAETAGRTGALPLLSTTLVELWQNRSGDRMTVRAYEETGGLQGAVARLAEKAYASLTAQEAQAARNILLRLAGETESESDAAVRRQVPLEELDLARSEPARHVIDVLTRSRLLTIGGDTVEVAHEALLREWPRLRGWLEEDAEARRLHGHITLAARDWEAGGRDAAELYRGARLASALDFAAAHGDALNALEREFLAEARLVSERDALRSRRANRRLRAVLAAALAALAITAVAVIAALDQRGDARQAATTADAQRLGAQALTEERIDRALLLARAGVTLEDSVATRGSLLATLTRSPPALLGVLPQGDDAEIYAVAVSQAGDRVAFGDSGGRVRVLALPSRRLVGTYRLGIVHELAFSPDGRTLAVSGDLPDRPPGGTLDLLDARSLQRRLRTVLPPLPEPAPFVAATQTFAPEGDDILILQTAFGSRQPQVLRRIDGATGRLVGAPLRLASPGHYRLLSSADRRRLFVTGPGQTLEMSSPKLRVVRRYPEGGAVGAVRPDGRAIALGDARGRVRLLALASGRSRWLAGTHRTAVNAMAFGPRGNVVVSAGEDGSLIARDQLGRAEPLPLHRAKIEALAIARDGRTLFSGGDDAREAVWDLTGRRRLVRSVRLGPAFQVSDPTPRGAALSPDDRTLAVTRSDGTVDLIDAATLRRRALLRAGTGPVLAVSFSPDGRLIATSGTRGDVALWSAATLTRVARLQGLRGWTQALAFSPDGRRLAASEVNRDPAGLRVWDVERGTLTAFRSPTAANALAFSPDGKLLVAAAGDQGAEIRDAATGRLVRRLATDEVPARSAAFSPDGRLLFVGRFNGSGQFYSTTDWRPAGRAIRGQDQRLTTAQFTPDGRVLMTASADGTVLLWDVATRRPIGSPIAADGGRAARSGRTDAFVTGLIDRAGRRLFALPTSGEGITLTLSSAAWNRHACLVAGRQMTASEWRDVAPRQPFRAVC